MDIDQLKSEEEQVEIMTMMEKSPELFATDFNKLSGFPIETPQIVSSNCNSFINLPLTNMNTSPVHELAAIEPRYSKSHSSKQNSMEAMREMIFRIAAMQRIHIDSESVKPPKRRNVKISKDPQSVAARHRRERISERIRILQRMVPGGTKMDTASMLDEAIHYVKFLKNQVQTMERASVHYNNNIRPTSSGVGFPVVISSGNFHTYPIAKPYQVPHNLQHYGNAYD